MAASPDDAGDDPEALDPDGQDPLDWDDEWNREDWAMLDEIDRGELNQDSWGQWALSFVGIASVLPVVLGILALLLILAF